MRTIMLIPASPDIALQIIAAKFINALATHKITATYSPPFDIENTEKILSTKDLEMFLEKTVSNYEDFAKNKNNTNIIIKGFAINAALPYAQKLNLDIATALDAAIIFIVAIDSYNPKKSLSTIKMIVNQYLNDFDRHVLGCIVDNTREDESVNKIDLITQYNTFNKIGLRVIGSVSAFTENFDVSFIKNIIQKDYVRPVTPQYFRWHLLEKAREANKTIILPEGDEPRTLQAANICAEQKIARCILMGKKELILTTAKNNFIELNPTIQIIDPDTIREKYILPLFELRKHKGMTTDEAKVQLQDNVVLGTMMLQLGEVDGLVSGAMHTTANTIRPALQIIKTVPDINLVSSVFFMCLANHVLVYGDCAINQNPNSEQLADIAIQSADTAKIFGITPKVAMLSFSTGDSAAGPDVDKVREAANIAKNRRPDLLIEGPIQYDAAISKHVATLKIPQSKIAGESTVFVFPDLDAGNIAYKAVAQSANIVAVGPIIQGLRKPVNDLSRGCIVEDIVFTIAITAVQAK